MQDSDILLAINKTFESYKRGTDWEVKSASSRTVKVIVRSADRASVQKDLNEKLKKLGVRYENKTVPSESSFPVTDIKLKDTNFRIIYKGKKGAGGSGAGAALTKTAESAQCLYAAMAFNVLRRPLKNEDVLLVNFEKAVKTAITDEKFKTMVDGLPDEWVNSSIKGANALYAKYKGGNYEFHRGSKQVDTIEKAFTQVNKNEKAFGNLNKWSPADIYLIQKGFDVSPIMKEQSLLSLNQLMWKWLSEGKVIGVSLKKIVGSPKISPKNFPTDKKVVAAEYKGSTSNADAMDGYIQWGSATTEKIQFRSFGGGASLTGWQGEIKGKNANQGKISHGPINFILKLHGLQQLEPANVSASLAKSNTKDHAKKIAGLMADFGIIGKNEIDDNILMVQSKEDKWRYSKYLVLSLLTTMKKANKKTQDAVVKDMYLYASSQANYSAPYMKME